MEQMAISHVTDKTFTTEMKEGLVLVDFWAPWCGPCKMIAPVLEEIDQEMGDQLKIAKLNVDDNPETTAQFGVMSIPTMLLMKEGQVVEKIVGFQPKEQLQSRISTHL